MAQRSEVRVEPEKGVDRTLSLADPAAAAASPSTAGGAVASPAPAPATDSAKGGAAPANDATNAAPAPPVPVAPVVAPWRSYKEIVAGIAQRIVDAQRPIRVLQALCWDPAVEEA